MSIYYLGPNHSFSHNVAQQAFGHRADELMSLPSFADIFERVLGEPSSLGIIPIENSITSDVHENVDSIFQHDIRIAGEAYLKLHLVLIGLVHSSLKTINKVYSHPKVLEQCRSFLRLNRLIGIPVRSTSEAMQILLDSGDENSGIIGAGALATSDKVTVLAEGLTSAERNLTRFVYISQTLGTYDPNTKLKMTITFMIKHQPAALANMLQYLGATGANLTKIESRPIPDSDWEYNFWIDLLAPSGTSEQIITTVRHHTLEYRLVGAYKPGLTYHST